MEVYLTKSRSTDLDVFTNPGKLQKLLKLYFGGLLPIFKKAVLKFTDGNENDVIDPDAVAEEATQPAPAPKTDGKLETPEEERHKVTQKLSGTLTLNTKVPYSCVGADNGRSTRSSSVISSSRS